MAKNKSKKSSNKSLKRRNTSTPIQKKKKMKLNRSNQNQPSTSKSPPKPKYQSTPATKPKPQSPLKIQTPIPIHFDEDEALFSQFRVPRSIDDDEEVILPLYPVDDFDDSSTNQNEAASQISTNQSSVSEEVNQESTNQSSASEEEESTNQISESDENESTELSDSIQAFTPAEKAELKKFRKEGLQQRKQMSLIEKTKILWFIHGKKEAAKYGLEVFRKCGRSKKKERKQPSWLNKKKVQDHMDEYYKEHYNELYVKWGRFFLKACPISSREIKTWEDNLLTFGCIDPFLIEKATNLPLKIDSSNLDES